MSEPASRLPVGPLLALPAVWLGHAALTYAAASLYCLHGTLGSEVLGLLGMRLLVIAVSVAAAALFGAYLLRVVRPLRGSDDELARQFSIVAGLLSAGFLIYLVWWLVISQAVIACHR